MNHSSFVGWDKLARLILAFAYNLIRERRPTHGGSSIMVGLRSRQSRLRWKSRSARAGPTLHLHPNVHPSRYSRRINRSASGQFVALRFFASHSSFLPARYATFPRWLASVSQPEYS